MNLFEPRELRDDEKQALTEKAEAVVRAKLNQNNMPTEEQVARFARTERNSLPRRVEDVPPRGIVLQLTKGQRWRREVVSMDEHFRHHDPDNAKFLGFRWCSAARTLVFFDCRNFERGAYAYSDPAQYV